MSTSDRATALTRAAATTDDILAIVDRAMMFAASDETDIRMLRRRLEILNDVAPVALLGAGEAGHLPRPARALATLIDHATYDETDWAWIRKVLRSLQLDPGALLVETRAALPVRQTRRVAVFLTNPDDYILIPVERLPFAHNPYECEYIDMHQAFADKDRQAQRTHGRLARLLRRPRPDADPDLAAGRRLNDLLITGTLPKCHKHQDIDWAQAMSDAESIQGNTRPWTPQQISTDLGIESDDNSTPQQRFVRDLFLDPVRWDSRRPRLENGQHRVCGARLAGIPQLMIGMPADERPADLR